MQETLEFVRTSSNAAPSIPFKDFLLKDKFNRFALVLCAAIIIIEFCVFKYYYPYAAFINGDSFAYLETAHYNLSINTYPVGYSMFLRLFSVFSSSDTLLVAFQYVFMQTSVLSLIFTITYFYEPRKWIKVIMIGAVVLSPISLYMANYVSSDSLFFSLSVTWFVLLIWILHRPSLWLIAIHSIVIFLAFTVRYNAMYYPVISVLAFFLSKEKIKEKIIGMGIIVVLIGSFVVNTSLHYQKLTGKFQFSPFTGWQMASNGLLAYRYVDSAQRKNLPVKFKKLDQGVRNYFDSTRNDIFEKMLAHTMYMWRPQSPLRVYMRGEFKNDSTTQELQKWASVGPLLNEYGSTLIKEYPLTFTKKYLWPNFLKYYAPPVEFLENYGFNVDTISPIAKRWFGYSTNKVYRRLSGKKVEILNYYPMVCGAMNAVFVMVGLSFLILGGRKAEGRFFQTWVLFVLFWLANLSFSVFAAPIALRFQVFPLVICFAINWILIDFIIKKASVSEDKNISA